MAPFQVNEFCLKAQLSDSFGHSFRHTIFYLISFPLTTGEGLPCGVEDFTPQGRGWGWTSWTLPPPHLHPVRYTFSLTLGGEASSI
jgi:hypothetical protein